MKILDTILSVIFPVNCISCGKSGQNLCIKCLSESSPALRECASFIFPLFDYRDRTVKKSIWLLKYKGKKGIANVFAEVMYDKITEELSELSLMRNFREPILIPIPLSPKRYKERGYNQSELICKKLIEIDIKNNSNNNLKLEKNILIKIKETEHQANIKDRCERLKNLSESFAIKNENLLKGRNIILIDDVITTGATLNEAKKILKKFGAKKVIAFTVAH